MKSISLNYRFLVMVVLVCSAGYLFSQENGVNPEEHAKHIREQIHMMTFSPAKHDEKGRLLPQQPYEETIDRAMSFIFEGLDGWFKGDPNTLYDEDGQKKAVYFYYANLAMDGQTFRGAPDNYVSYPAFHHASFINTFIQWYQYSGNREALEQAIELANWNIKNATPLHYPYGGMPYSTFNKGKPGGFRDGEAIMPDKAAIMGMAYLNLYKVIKDNKYLDAALSIAEKLAGNQLPAGNWPFRVDPLTRAVKEGYTSSVIYQIQLFGEIMELTQKETFQKNKEKALDWLLNNPVKTGIWTGFYEDIQPGENRTNFDCIDAARYFLKHREENPEYLQIALTLNDYITKTVISQGRTFINTAHPYAPAEGVREQKACFVTMGVHSAHWALLMADLYYATGDESYKERAVQTMNFVTYHLQPDGKILVGIDYEHESGGWAFNQFWFSCHIMPNLYLMEFLALFPEYAKQGPHVPSGFPNGNVVANKTVEDTVWLKPVLPFTESDRFY